MLKQRHQEQPRDSTLPSCVPIQKKKLDMQISSNNLDLNLLQNIIQIKGNMQGAIFNNKPVITNNKMSLNNLADILKQKNQKYQVYKHQKQQAKNWLKQKGINFQKINKQIKQNEKLSDLQIRQNLIIKQKLGVPAPLMGIQLAPQTVIAHKPWNFTIDNQLEFVNKQKDNILKSTIFKKINQRPPKSNISTTSFLLQKIRRSTKDRAQNILNKKFIIHQTQEYSKLYPHLNQQQKNQKKKLAYFNFIQQLSTYGFQQTIDKLVPINFFWKLVYQHIKTIQHYETSIQNLQMDQKKRIYETFQQRINSFLMMKSLKYIQKQYQKKISSNFDNDILLDIKQIQRKNKRIKIWRDRNGKPAWAIAYFLFRARKINEFKKVLEDIDKQYIEDFIRYQQSVDLQSPQPSQKNYDIHKFKDNYFNQLVYIIKASPKFDPQIIDSDNIDTVWILLRTLGIYRNIPQLNQKFQEIVDIIFEKAAEDQYGPINKQNILKYLFLGGYKQLLDLFGIIAKKNPQHLQDNQFNVDDYFHLYTIINYYPQLYGSISKKQKDYLNHKYSQALIRYLQILYSQKKYQQLHYYLLLAPPSQLQKVALSFIKNRDHFIKFKWRQMKQLMIKRDSDNGKSNFQFLIQKVLDNIQLKTFQDYVFAIKQYRGRLNNSLNSVIKQLKLANILLMKKLYFTQKKRFQLMKSESNLKQFENQVLQFFELANNLNQVQSKQKIFQKQEQFNKFILQCQKLLQQKRMSQHLNNKQYRKNIEIPYMFYKQFKKLNKLINQSSLQSINYKNLKEFQTKFIMQTANSFQLNKQQEQILTNILSICQFLHEQINPRIQSLFVFYMLSLIRRKQIISNLEYDYRESMQFRKVIYCCLLKLQKYYQNKLQQQRSNSRNLLKNQIQQNKIRNPFKFSQQYKDFKKELIVKYNYQNQQYNRMNTLSERNNKLIEESLRQFSL